MSLQLFSNQTKQLKSVSNHDVAFTHHVWVSSPQSLSLTDLNTLGALLNAAPNKNPSSSACLVISARTGTLSPWSSKAQDIADQCGVAWVRLEQVTAYDLSAVPESERAAVTASLYDRMTQSVHTSLAASKWC